MSRVNRRAIMQALYDGHVLLSNNEMTPKWESRWMGCPSLNNVDVSHLFRSGCVQIEGIEIKLSSWGKVILESKA